MPELPEVETVVRGLRDAGLPGLSVEGARILWPRTVDTHAPAAFDKALAGRRILEVQRRAKYIVIALEPTSWLLIHLRMTGNLTVVPASVPREDHERAALRLDDGRELRFRDTRKFGRWSLVDDLDARLGHLGPEPLDPAFRVSDFCALVQGRARMLKPLLLDQTVLAGLGNIYVDEALWKARLHPCMSGNALSRPAAHRLYTAVRRVLQCGVEAMGTTLGRGVTNFYSVAGRRGRHQDGLQVFRRHGEPCPRCRTLIERIVVGQRSTHICPHCQRRPFAAGGSAESLTAGKHMC